jgi:hypothetical protein
MSETSIHQKERTSAAAWWRPAGVLNGVPGVAGWRCRVLMAATFLIVLDFFIGNVAAPSIQAGLGMNAGELEWVLAGHRGGVLQRAARRYGHAFAARPD